jgi:hypothetical protein
MLYYRDKHQQQLKFYLLPGSSFKECFIELVYTFPSEYYGEYKHVCYTWKVPEKGFKIKWVMR